MEARQAFFEQVNTMLAGYARVSTLDQNPELQLDALSAAGCERIFEDRASGARSDRPGLAEALDWMREGDTLVVWKLDRLGRSLPQLVATVCELGERGFGFRSLTEGIDTTAARTGRSPTSENLYTKHDSSGNPDMSTEKDQGVVEGDTAPVIDKIIRCSLDGNCPHLSPGEKGKLGKFIFHQYKRTPEDRSFIDKKTDGWLAEAPAAFENEYGRKATPEELVELEVPEYRQRKTKSRTSCKIIELTGR